MTRFERWSVWSSAIATGLTGLGFFWAKYLVESSDPWALVNHPLEPWLLKIHILVAPVFVFAVGLITIRHVLMHIRARIRRGRLSGLAMVWLMIPMVGSGYLIQVVSTEGWLTGLAIAHIVTGAIFLLAIAAHRVRISSSQSRVAEATRTPILKS
ncbi:MAG: hypothetical protein V3T20_00200 [Gemmatimonadota bacterium]